MAKITVTSAGNKVNIATSPDMSMFYTERSREWAISDKIVNNEDYSSKYYANISKEQAQISTNKTEEVVNSGNEALSNIDNAKTGALTDIETNKTNAITDIVNQENLSVNNVNIVGETQVNNVNSAGTTQINLAKEQVTLATVQANIATTQAGIATAKTSEVIESGNNALTAITEQETTSKNNIEIKGAEQIELIQNEGATQVNLAKEQATIATTQAGIATDKTIEVIESGNTALANIDTAKSDALNEINTTGAGYVENAEQYAQNALTSANNSSASEANALSYKNSALESSQTATEQANIAVTNANKAITSATNAKTSETNAKSSETRCEEILSRLGTAIKIKGRVDSVGDLPLGDNLDGDAYLVGEEGLDSYPEYYWYQDHWEFLGTSGTSLSWGLISGDITSQNDLMDKLNTKQNVLTAGTGIDITNNVISNTQTSAEWGNIQGTISAQEDLQTALDNKQDKGDYALKSEIPTNNNQLINGAGYITSSYHDSTKQDVISDLESIRAGAAKGATAIQNTNDCVHLTGNETIAGTKTFSSTISGSIDGKSTQLDTPRVNTDYNSLPIKNTTYIEEHQNPSSNQPEANWFFAQTMQGADTGYAGQLAMGMTSENVYYRNKNAGNWSTWKKLAFTKDNVASATKATQDSAGQQINTTYVKGVTASNATITVTKGNGTTSTATINNVANATKATNATKAIQDGNGNVITTTYTKTDLSNLTGEGKSNLKQLAQEELNNPYSLFDHKYSSFELNNISWLKSNGQWNAKAVYPDAYDKLLKVYNGTETVEGLSVKLSTETYTDYDFVLNTSDETFRLPLLDGSESLISGRYDDLGVDTSKSTWHFVAPSNGFVSASVQFTNQDTYIQMRNQTKNYHYQTPGITGSGYQGNLLPVEKGDAYAIAWSSVNAPTKVYWARFYYAKGNGTLYYYVGETVQNAKLIDAGRIGEQLASKTDKVQAAQASMPSSKYIDLTLGASGATYTAPANGWFNLRKRSTAAAQYIYILGRIFTQNFSVVKDDSSTLFHPVSEGEVVKIYYTLGGTTELFRFIYAEGEVS